MRLGGRAFGFKFAVFSGAGDERRDGADGDAESRKFCSLFVQDEGSLRG